jgi:hypothetical protein
LEEGSLQMTLKSNIRLNKNRHCIKGVPVMRFYFETSSLLIYIVKEPEMFSASVNTGSLCITYLLSSRNAGFEL